MSGAMQIDVSAEQTGSEAPPQATERPAHVPEKFWDAKTGTINTEALLSSYGELEKKIGGGKPAAAQGDAGAPSEADPGDKSAAEGGDKSAAEGDLDVSKYEQIFVDNGGKLTDEAYAELAERGYPKAIVDEFIGYRVANIDRQMQETYAAVGGQEQFEKMAEWASKNWNEDQAKAYNEAVNSGDKGRIDLALRALKADYSKANGSRPQKLLNGGGANVPGGDVFANMQQLMAAQNDPRYRTDPAYRQSVIDKLARSPFMKGR